MLNTVVPSSRRLHGQRGLSIVELMVGVAVGLIVVSAATLMVAGQLADNRRLLLETQVQQDLRAATDLITRELRRASSWRNAVRATAAGSQSAPRLTNPYSDVSPAGDNESSSQLSFSYADPGRNTDNDVIDDDERLGFRLNNGTLESLLGANNWQPLTDPGVLRVTGFSVLSRVQPVTLDCPLACSAGPTPCPPVQQIRSYTVDISAQAVHDPQVQRSIRSVVRVRNDAIVGECRD